MPGETPSEEERAAAEAMEGEEEAETREGAAEEAEVSQEKQLEHRQDQVEDSLKGLDEEEQEIRDELEDLRESRDSVPESLQGDLNEKIESFEERLGEIQQEREQAQEELEEVQAEIEDLKNSQEAEGDSGEDESAEETEKAEIGEDEDLDEKMEDYKNEIEALQKEVEENPPENEKELEEMYLRQLELRTKINGTDHELGKITKEKSPIGQLRDADISKEKYDYDKLYESFHEIESNQEPEDFKQALEKWSNEAPSGIEVSNDYIEARRKRVELQNMEEEAREAYQTAREEFVDDFVEKLVNPEECSDEMIENLPPQIVMREAKLGGALTDDERFQKRAKEVANDLKGALDEAGELDTYGSDYGLDTKMNDLAIELEFKKDIDRGFKAEDREERLQEWEEEAQEGRRLRGPTEKSIEELSNEVLEYADILDTLQKIKDSGHSRGSQIEEHLRNLEEVTDPASNSYQMGGNKGERAERVLELSSGRSDEKEREVKKIQDQIDDIFSFEE
ncbi:MAG: hypothetical protein ABEJ02_01285 [Candidatus Paceibacteria bacterium]